MLHISIIKIHTDFFNCIYKKIIEAFHSLTIFGNNMTFICKCYVIIGYFFFREKMLYIFPKTLLSHMYEGFNLL